MKMKKLLTLLLAVLLLVLADWLIVAVLAGLVPQPHRGDGIDLPVLQVLRHLGEH